MEPAASSAPAEGKPSCVAVLVSGGLDSSILLVEMLRRHEAVYPLYISQGLFWEAVERQHLERFLAAVRTPTLQPLHVLEVPVRDLYGDAWSITGKDVPGGSTPDEAVYLPGRNVLLLAKAFLWCHLHRVPAVALAPLETNPFPDATPTFFLAFQDAVNQAVGGRVQVLRPYARLHKTEVMQRGKGLPLQLTFSCIRPLEGLHCGQCNKCAERRRAFHEAGMEDPTAYTGEE